MISYAIRAYTWHRHKAYIHIEAIQLSFLAGRILFKNLSYKSRNQSIQILKGHITCRYWLRRTRVRQNHKIKEIANAKLPCRIVLVLEGVEWCIYNRTPAYDAIIAATEQNEENLSGDGGIERAKTKWSAAEGTSVASLHKHNSGSIPPSAVDRYTEEDDNISPFIHFLPIQVVGKKGAIILGNTNTESIVVAQFMEANLVIDAAESKSKFDLYKMVYDCIFIRPTIQIKMNIDYEGNFLERASHGSEQVDNKIPRCPFIPI